MEKLEKNKQLSQQQILLIDYNHTINGLEKSIKQLNQHKKEVLTRIDRLDSGNDATKQVSSKDAYLSRDLEEIRAKNKELEDKLEAAKANLERKDQQFKDVKAQIDSDFEDKAR